MCPILVSVHPGHLPPSPSLNPSLFPSQASNSAPLPLHMSQPPHQHQQQHPPASSSAPASQPSPPQPRPARSKNGCNACRRRKVRCNEHRPRCSHCERLNLDCTWHRPAPARSSSISHPSRSLVTSAAHGQHPSFASASLPLDAYGYSLDISGPLSMGVWDEAMLLSPSAWPTDAMPAADSIYQLHDAHQSAGPLVEVAPAVRSQPRHYRPDAECTSSPFSTESAPNGHAVEELLLNSFLQMLMPPILTPVEIGPKWSSTRAFFATMAAESPLVKSAIMAFAAMQMQRGGLGGDAAKVDWRLLYDKAFSRLPSRSAEARPADKADGASSHGLRHVLAALFLLTYIDLLTETLTRAHANLREAYNLIQNAESKTFSLPERRLISWLRLLDARAVSTAGGEGLFLAETDESLFDASPAAIPGLEPETSDLEIEDILFDVLYRPGIVFFHKIHSVAGRITRIDPWHRSRGTVEDETEVMALAAQISKDLHTIYSQRPILMDHAIAGNLTEKHLAKNLARALTQGFRTYLCNYYASFLHLHRVAYVQYPKTQDVIDAVANIKRLCHLMTQSDERLPVNVLWPLFMAGCEEVSRHGLCLDDIGMKLLKTCLGGCRRAKVDS
ncbi:hypothetical protein ACJQWK_09658 [Exserohilum turcicum]